MHPRPPIDQKTHCQHQQKQDERNVIAKSGAGLRIGPFLGRLLPNPHACIGHANQGFGPIGRVDWRGPEFEQLVGLPLTQHAVNFGDQAIRATIGLFCRKAGGLQGNKLFRQDRPTLRDLLHLRNAFAGGWPQGGNLGAQRCDAGGIGVLFAQKGAAPIHHLPTDRLQSLGPDVAVGRRLFCAFSQPLPSGIVQRDRVCCGTGDRGHKPRPLPRHQGTGLVHLTQAVLGLD